MKRHQRIRIGFAALALTVLWGASAQAVPILQLFIEGSKYDADTETWVTTARNFKLLVIGNTSPGSILDVQLAAAYVTGETGSITIRPTRTSLFEDPSMAAIPLLNTHVGADGTIPLMNDGHLLPNHTIYGPGSSFLQWGLGDFAQGDSPVGDFFGKVPTSFPATGQISAYSVTIWGYSRVHFDTFDHTLAQRKAYFAPFTTESAQSVVPEPASILILGLGLAGSLVIRRRKG